MSVQVELHNADGACTARHWLLSACVLALALLPGPASADPRTTFSPARPTMNVTVLPDGTLLGERALKVKITRTDKPTGVLQSCDKVDYVDLTSTTDTPNASKEVGGQWIKPPLCSFSRTVTYTPFSIDELRAACVVVRSHTTQRAVTHEVMIDYYLGGSQNRVNHKYIKFYVRANVTCKAGATSSAAPSAGSTRSPANVRPVNACDFTGDWPVWETGSDRPAVVPFVLVANQGRSDVYQVSTPNNAGVTGTALVTGYNVTISLQGSGRHAGMMNLSGTLGRNCAALRGQAVHSDMPIPWAANRRGGESRAPAGSNQTRSMPNRSRSQPARRTTTAPRVPARVAPNWNTRLR